MMPKTPMRLDEVRGILADDDALAEDALAEGLEALDDGGVGGLAAHDFEQRHVADGVEEVGDGEVLLEGLRAALDHALDRQARGVRGDDGAGLHDAVEAREELLLHVEALEHHLDDEVALGGAAQIVVEVADFDQVGVLLREQQRRLALHDVVLATDCEAVAEGLGGGVVLLRRLRRHDVEEDHGDAGVGEVGGDALPHDPGTDDTDLLERRHRDSSASPASRRQFMSFPADDRTGGR